MINRQNFNLLMLKFGISIM